MKVVSRVTEARNRLCHRALEATSYFYNLTKSIPSNQVRLLIFGQGRTGSTLLESLICSTGYFHKNGELLNNDKGEILFPIHYIRGLSKYKASENFIFHLKIYQLTRDRRHPIDPAKFLNVLSSDGWKVIYLRRRNKVKHALSNFVAEHRNAAHKFDDELEKPRLLIDCDHLIARVNERFRFRDAERNALADIKYHEVIYEDGLEKPDSHQLTINKILDYVSLEHRMASTNHRKVNTQSLKDLIINYDEFVDCLIKRKWHKFLGDFS